MKALALVCVFVALGGCTTFPLGTVHAAPGTSAQAQQVAILVCKDAALTAANATGQQVKESLLGLTIVGYPVAVASDRARQRAVFASCMRSQGYEVGS